MNRRHVLIGVVLVAFALMAGCSAPGSIELHPVNDTQLADQASRSTEPGGPVPDQAPTPPWAVAEAAIENGSTTVTARAPPLEPGLPFEHEGAYYNLSYDVVATHERTAVSLGIDYNATNTSGAAIRYEELPPADKALLDALLPQRQPPGPGMDLAASLTYTAAELDASVLAPDQQYDVVIYEGDRYRIRLEGTEMVTVYSYAYDATQIAANTTAYAAHLRATYAFTFQSLPEAQQAILEDAIGDEYTAESSDDAAFDALVDRFLAHDAIERDASSGTWLLRYDGTLYVVDLRYGGFVDT